MKAILTSVLAWFVLSISIAQDKDKEVVGFACYFAGQPTETVVRLTNLINARNYKAISELLTTGNSGEKYLAVVSLEKLHAYGYYTLSDNERRLISIIKSS